MDRVRNRRVVRAGDTLQIEVTVQKLRETMGRMAGLVKVDGQTITYPAEEPPLFATSA